MTDMQLHREVQAYIVGFVDTTVSPPVIRGARILSENNPTSELRKAYPVELMRFYGTSFHEAYKAAEQWLCTAPRMDWMYRLVYGTGRPDVALAS